MKIKNLAFLVCMTASSVFAQSWPEKPVKVVIAVQSGGGTDVMARLVFKQISEQTGKNFIMENRAGASGVIAAREVAKSDPDGYTLLVNTVTHTVVATSFKNLNYNVENDFTNIAGMVSQPFVIATGPRWKNITELTKYAKENPNKLSYGTPGVGTSGHLFMEKVTNATNMKMLSIPYKGTSEAYVDLFTNRIDMYPAPVSTVAMFAKDGKMNALAVSSNKRNSAIPNVPSMAEIGLPEAEYLFWIGVFGPAKMEKSLVDRINLEIIKAMDSPELRNKLINEFGAEPIRMSPTQFDAYVKREIKHNAEIIKRSNIVME